MIKTAGVDFPVTHSMASKNGTSLEDCINMAMPKPKPPSERFRRRPQKTREKEQNSVGSGRGQGEGRPLASSEPVEKEVIEDGILEVSGISLVRSSEDALMKCSSATDLEDVMPPEGLMDISVTSCSLMRNSATTEKVKDASNLVSRLPTAAESPRNVRAEGSGEPASGTVVKGESECSESLSEDNYSRLDEDENFDISPEDIDLNLVEEDANKLVIQLEGGDLISDGDLLIECETLSLVSNESRLTSDTTSQDGTAPIPEGKVVKGGQRKTTPKVAVRTTKTAQLRAKRASESSNDGRNGSSASVVSGKGSPCRSASTASDSDRPKSKSRPPVPPKPQKLLNPSKREMSTRGKSHSTPASARVSPFNYRRTPTKAADTKTTTESDDRKTPNSSRGSSKRMLVTTV